MREQWDAVYKLLTDQGFSQKPVMEGAGTAAGEAYAWAIENPEKVACIYSENAVMRSLMVKKPAAREPGAAGESRRAAHSRLRQPRPVADSQTRIVEKRYKELGGPITVIVNEGVGHYPLAPKDVAPVVALIAKQAD